MGYLNNSTIVVDAILTKKGRQLLAKGKDEFSITQFALADDEIDYSLWDASHPLGSDYYGITIENMPIIEAVPNESYMMKYKLVTLGKKTTRIPVVTVPNTSIVLQAGGDKAQIVPGTSNFDKGNATLGYTAILSNSDVAYIRATRAVTGGLAPTAPRFIGDDEAAQSVAVTGFDFEVVAKEQPIETKTATIVIVGNETGGRATITLTVNKMEVATSGAGL